MLNEIENNNTLNAGMSDLEFDKNKVEMMRYRVNGLSYKLGLGGLVFSILAAFICMNSFQPSTFLVIFKILLNIVILLAGFLFCEKTKNYSSQGAIGLTVLGGMCVARIFWVPLQILVHYGQWVSASKEYAALPEGATLEQQTEIQNRINAHGKYLGLTIRTEYEEAYAVNWLPHSGNFRATIAIVFLCIAAALFITAGVIGYIRAKKLHNYLDSIKVKG